MKKALKTFCSFRPLKHSYITENSISPNAMDLFLCPTQNYGLFFVYESEEGHINKDTMQATDQLSPILLKSVHG